MTIKPALQNDINEIPLLAVAIKKTSAGLNHTGMLYKRNSREKTKLFHLEWHHKLTNENAEEKIGYCWGESDLCDAVKRRIIGQIINILRHKDNPPVQYGFSRHGLSFDEKGYYIKTLAGEGLTCATFVLDIFKSVGIPILKEDGWPTRDEDQEWKEFIVSELEKTPNIEEDHIEALKQSENIVRFRPEEVAAGYIEESRAWPASLEQVQDKASEINNSI